MRVDIITIFPEVIDAYGATSILGRAQDAGHLDLRVHDLRDGTDDPHRSVDDAPFGGGAGMVLKPDPIFRTVEAAETPRPILYLSPTGRTLDQDYAHELSSLDGFTLLCGRYEGVDERVRTHLIDGEVSIGDYVLAGGELAALVVLESVTRLIPGVLGNDTSTSDESFSDGLLEYPHYTRPADYRGWVVPEVLRSGNHARIERWRRAQSLRRTIDRRPDLIAERGGLGDADVELLAEFDLG